MRSSFLLLAFSIAAFSAYAADEGGPRQMSPEAKPSTHDSGQFGPDPSYANKPYDPAEQLRIYGGKSAVQTPRPLLELGRPIYLGGEYDPSGTGFGAKNPTDQAFAIYGDLRTAFARNQNGGNSRNTFAARLNLDVDWKLTGTERLHAFFRPLDHGNDITRCDSPNGRGFHCERAMDLKPETLFFEGDLGALSAGWSGQYKSWDLPFAVGKIPLLFQNGIWLEDAFTGLALTLPAKNSPALGISNYDVTFFAGIDDVDSGAIRDAAGALNSRQGHVYGATTFIEAMQGYWELGYAYTEAKDRFGTVGNQSYHNIGIAFTRRYGGWLSNSVRIIHNTGQNLDPGVRQTADGTLLLVENSLVTRRPLTLVPYMNLFVGKDRPQSVARDPGAGGILKNTGINFETDGMTGFPRLDDTGNNAVGGALGVQYLFDLQRQIVVEWGTVHPIGDAAARITQGQQNALGVRYQQNLTKAWLFRTDAMVANRVNARDIGGIRFELRRKF
jgi:hypothetical protein